MKHQVKILSAVCGLMMACVPALQAQWCIAGPFNGWNAGSTPMIAGPNAGEFSYTITGGTPGALDQCKITDGTWANNWPGNNLSFQYDSTGSATIHFWPGFNPDGWVPAANRVGYDVPDTNPGWGLAGDFDGWDGTQAVLASLGSGVYSNSIVVPTAENVQFKFQSPAGSWSAINFGSPDFGNGNNNGSFPTTTSPQTLPVVLDLPGGRYYVGAPAVPPTNWITFQLDMSAQVLLGKFTNTDLNPLSPTYGLPVNSVAVAGDFIGWGTGAQLTNITLINPADPRTNLYVGAFPDQGYLPLSINWKFRVNNIDGGYEQPVSTAGGNRVTSITNANQVLPVISYDDLKASDLVQNDTWVTFSVYVTNGTPTDAGGFFAKGSDTVWVSGAWLGWPAWGYNALPPNQQMFESATPDVYTNTLLVPKGSSLQIIYKYSFDGIDNENGSGTNHIRYIRTYAPNYTFTQDAWSWALPGNGSPYPNPGITSTNIVEPSFGYLAIGAPSAGKFPITWLGRPGVILQNTANVTGGVWNSLTATDGTQATNWPNAGDNQFFRLLQY